MKKNINTTRTWLLSFEKVAGKPVVVSLLIQDGEIDFLQAIDRKRFFLFQDDDDEEDEGGSNVTTFKRPIKGRLSSRHSVLNYIS